MKFPTNQTCGERLWSGEICQEIKRPIRLSSGRVTFGLCLRCHAQECGHCWNCGKVRENDSTQAWFCDRCATVKSQLYNQEWNKAHPRRRSVAQSDA